jgi:hypothetical protein
MQLSVHTRRPASGEAIEVPFRHNPNHQGIWKIKPPAFFPACLTCVFTAVACVCVFITAVPIIRLFDVMTGGLKKRGF